MKILRGQLVLGLAALAWMVGCASIGPPLPPSLELPKPPTDLHAARKGDRVSLTWTVPTRTTDRQRVRYLGKTRICRSLDQVIKQCEKPVGETESPADFRSAKKTSVKLRATFIDTLPSILEREHPDGFATYAVEVLNTSGRGAGLSNQVHVPLVPTLPPFSDFSAKVVSQGVVVTWRCAPVPGAKLNGVKYLFRIYRRQEGSTSEAKIGELSAACVTEADTSNGSFLDQTFEWEHTYYYRGTVVSVMEKPGKPTIEVEGDDTPEVKVFAHDIFPPAVPAGLQAVFSGPGQQPFIDLIWAPVTDADLAGCNIYRHEAGGAAVKLNSEPVKAPAFRDMQVVSGKTYFYSVSAVDLRGNESARSEEASETVP
ncbi:MAG: hypothetical protein WB660_24735 [Candidatus Sulfotelmatobacter sp.]